MTASIPDYATYVSLLGQMASIQNPAADPNFQAVLPAAIDYAEQRIYRELNLLNTVGRATAPATQNQRLFTLPQANGANFVQVQGINVMQGSSRSPLVPKSREFVDFYAGGSEQSIAGLNPSVFAMLTDQQILLAPAPPSALTIEVVGTVRPSSFSNTNQSTFLTSVLPDLFLAASMIFVSGFQKNFGSQADNPQSAMSWEQQYQTLFASANSEEMRKRYNTAINAPGAAA